MRINYDRDSLISEQGMKLLQDYYMKTDDKSPQDSFARAAKYFASDDAHAQRLYDAVSRQHFMYASPILSNCEDGKGLPISCFLSYVPDDIDGLVGHEAEFKYLSVYGGGVGGHWDDVRSISKKAPGPIPFLHSVDGAVPAYKQGETRKGAYASYLSASHPSVNEFLQIRVPTGGDINRKCLNSHHGLNLTDNFMQDVVKGLEHDLKCPKTGKVVTKQSAREIWENAMTTRHRTGEPYLNFIDTANEFLHPAQKALGLTIRGSNLCNEIHLVTDAMRTAVCCLSSLNLEKYDEWKDSGLVGDLVEMLDNVLDVFIARAPDTISKARYAAMRSRDIGIGAMGWHGLLMKRRIAFESDAAITLTDLIFADIKAQAKAKTLELGKSRGACPDAQETGYPERNLHLLAVAPNANSSVLCNCTPSIEPVKGVAYAHRTRAGTHLIVNPIFKEFLKEKAPMDTLRVLDMTIDQWINKQIELVVRNEGSVEDLPYLTDHEKMVFRRFVDIDQHYVIEQAAVRQTHLCQGQSVNLAFPGEVDKAYFNSVHLMAWNRKLKGLYYVRTESVADADKVSAEVIREALGDADDECTNCHG